jgi:hypothetical protein
MIGGLWQLARNRAKELLEAADSSRLALITEALEALLQAGKTGLQQSRR